MKPFLISLLTGLGGLYIGHLFTKNRKILEQTFNERAKVYSEIMEAMGAAFVNPENPIGDLMSTHTEFSMKMRLRVGKLFSRGRLFAGYELEKTFRDYYSVMSEELNTREIREKDSPKDQEIKREITYLTYKIEVLMRKELGVIGWIDSTKWLVLLWINYKFDRNSQK